MEKYEGSTGGQVIAIPHNGNVSNGVMFSDKRVDGSDFDKTYTALRQRWEPLYEVTQVKGDAEAHPYLSLMMSMQILKHGIRVTFAWSQKRKICFKENMRDQH